MILPSVTAPADDRRRLKALIALLLIVATAGWDQGSKSLARARLDGRPPVYLVGGVLQLRWVQNEGAFLSLGAALPKPTRMVIFVAFPLVVLAFMIGSLLRRRGLGWGQLIGLSLVVGGGAGNLVDRIFRDGRVGDFILLAAGRLHTGILNFADLFVTAGCVVLVFAPTSSRQQVTDGKSPG